MRLHPLLSAMLLPSFIPHMNAATLPAAEDSYSSRSKLTPAANAAPALSVDATHRAFIYFNLAELPAGASLRYARLRFYLPKVVRAGGGIEIHQVTGTWDEATAGPEPEYDSNSSAFIPPESLGKRRFVSMDVTSVVQGWMSAPATNEGFAIAAVSGKTPTLTASLSIGAKEGSGSGYPAELDVELNPVPVAGGSIGTLELAPNLNLGGTTTGTFSGNGSALTNISAANVSGQLTNSQLENSDIALVLGPGLSGGNSVALGGTLTLANTGVLSLSPGGGVTVSGTDGAFTLGSTATSTNTPGSIVQRDAAGAFTAGAISAQSFSGNGAGLTNVSAINGISVSSLVNINATFIEFVRIGSPGNSSDPATGNVFGAVTTPYLIGKYEVTNTQYVQFLNAVARSDTNFLFNAQMTLSNYGGIQRVGGPGSFSYAVKQNFGNKPVNFVSFFDAARFCNWLHNGMPTGPQDNNTTENGAYQISGSAPNWVVSSRNPGARAFLPSENEWYKAAYFDPDKGTSGGYWLYPTRSSAAPVIATSDAAGNINNPTSNVANQNFGAVWNGQNGNVVTVGSGGPGCESAFGAADMGGNVWEWLETPTLGNSRELRNGSWNASEVFMRSTFRDSDGDLPTIEKEDYGFRVAKP